MPVPYTFAAATTSNSLAQLDSNFATGITLGNTVVQLGNTIVTLNNITLVNATITSLAGPLVTLGSTPLTAGATVTVVAGLTLTSPTIATILNSGALTLPAGVDTLVARTSTDTLTNKRVTPRTGTSTPIPGTVTIPTDSFDAYDVTLPSGGTFTMAASGTPTADQMLHVSFQNSSGTSTLTWGSSFEASTVTLPATTSTTRLDLKFVWNTATSKWRLILKA